MFKRWLCNQSVISQCYSLFCAAVCNLRNNYSAVVKTWALNAATDKGCVRPVLSRIGQFSSILSSQRKNTGCDGQTSQEPESLGQGLGDRTLNPLSVSFSTFDLLFLYKLDQTRLPFTHLDMGRPLGNKDACAQFSYVLKAIKRYLRLCEF